MIIEKDIFSGMYVVRNERELPEICRFRSLAAASAYVRYINGCELDDEEKLQVKISLRGIDKAERKERREKENE